MDLQDHVPANRRSLIAATLHHETWHRDRYWFVMTDFDRSCLSPGKKGLLHQANDDQPIFHAALRTRTNYHPHYHQQQPIVDLGWFETVRATPQPHLQPLPEKDALERDDNLEQTRASLLMPTLR